MISLLLYKDTNNNLIKSVTNNIIIFKAALILLFFEFNFVRFGQIFVFFLFVK